ncbi:hypothetical protein RCF27_05935 [Rhodococcus pyridinivorans]|uniref:Uncharacterized protein n=1 Tax=Rhodococcus pyridinivorans TaxID=103816 RepID=A0A7M2XQC8_9NOCA|nr:hypothetical protein [Rhodococcus pyridinivorans]QOV99959.1 hypothetical protein INP59_06225 [Rhodococcus pyridinivorans]WMM73848.1 hypothetical protein RCF27_05935 [Rhodococcus pyridinivorans]
MGFVYYILPDGREAGYGVEAECDDPECHRRIDRGRGYLCGHNPLGSKEDDEAGCGNYFCHRHLPDHRCPLPECGVRCDDELPCSLVAGHHRPHRNTVARPGRRPRRRAPPGHP